MDCPETLVAILENVVFLVVSILLEWMLPPTRVKAWVESCGTTLKGLAVPITASGLQDE